MKILLRMSTYHLLKSLRLGLNFHDWTPPPLVSTIHTKLENTNPARIQYFFPAYNLPKSRVFHRMKCWFSHLYRYFLNLYSINCTTIGIHPWLSCFFKVCRIYDLDDPSNICCSFLADGLLCHGVMMFSIRQSKSSLILSSTNLTIAKINFFLLHLALSGNNLTSCLDTFGDADLILSKYVNNSQDIHSLSRLKAWCDIFSQNSLFYLKPLLSISSYNRSLL